MTKQTGSIGALLVGFLVATAGGVRGQGEEAKPSIVIRPLAFAPDPMFKEVFVHDPAAESPATPTGIKSYLNHQSVKVTATERKLVFTTSADRSSLKLREKRIAEVVLPPDLKSAILVFLPAPAGSGSAWRVLTVDDSEGQFPAGSFRVFNLSPLPVRIDLEGKPFSFKPGQGGLIEDPPMGPTEHAAMRAFSLEGKVWSAVSAGMWPDPGRGRVLQILYRDSKSGRIQLRGFDDVPPRVNAEPP
jgi:hypothetical protein